MYRAPRVVNRLIDQQMREIADKKHQEALRKMKPQIDTKRPPPVPRLVVYEKHQTRDRAYQIIDETMKIREIQEIERQRQSMRSSSSKRTSRPRIIDWTAELGPAHPRTSAARKRPVQSSSAPPQPHYEEVPVQTEVLEDDGMRVVDTTAPALPLSDATTPRQAAPTFASGPVHEEPQDYQYQDHNDHNDYQYQNHDDHDDYQYQNQNVHDDYQYQDHDDHNDYQYHDQNIQDDHQYQDHDHNEHHDDDFEDDFV